MNTFFDTARRILTLSCDGASELLSNSLDRPMPFGERAALRLHLLCCRFCRRYRRQINWLRTVSRSFDHLIDQPHAGPALSEAARVRIARAVQDRLDQDTH